MLHCMLLSMIDIHSPQGSKATARHKHVNSKYGVKLIEHHVISPLTVFKRPNARIGVTMQV